MPDVRICRGVSRIFADWLYGDGERDEFGFAFDVGQPQDNVFDGSAVGER